jgi:hypothetical protein
LGLDFLQGLQEALSIGASAGLGEQSLWVAGVPGLISHTGVRVQVLWHCCMLGRTKHTSGEIFEARFIALASGSSALGSAACLGEQT